MSENDSIECPKHADHDQHNYKRFSRSPDNFFSYYHRPDGILINCRELWQRQYMHICIIYQYIKEHRDTDTCDDRQRHISFRIFYFAGDEGNIAPTVVGPKRTEHGTKDGTQKGTTL